MYRLLRKTLFCFLYALFPCIVLAQEPIKPIPYIDNLNPQKVALGAALFSDTDLSSDGTTSCASCHSPFTYGVDGVTISSGSVGHVGVRNAPTVYNSVFNFRQFWDGRAATLADQIDGPIASEMMTNWPQILQYLAESDYYNKLFLLIYSDGITEDNVKDAIVEFERSLTTPDSPFDLYLKGDSDAISEIAKEGYVLFKQYGCAACHQGINVGGNMYEKLGVFEPYPHDNEEDLGRFHITNDVEDKYEFKVPSLRNVAETAPYFHDGSVKSLREAVQLMAKYQLGEDLSDSDNQKLVAFLKTLTGPIDE